MNYLQSLIFGSAALGVGGVFLRGILAYVTLNVMVRAMGQREVQQLTAVDFVVGITIGSIFAAALADPKTALWPSIISVAALVATKLMVAYLGMKHQRFSRLTSGEPVTLIKDGKIQEGALRKGLVTMDSLMEQLRKRKAFNLADVEFAILEPSGSVTVMKKTEHQPVTRKDLQVGLGSSWYPAFLVKEGRILHDNLKEVGLSEAWLQGQLANMGVTDLDEVFVAQLSTTGSLYVDTYEDEGPLKKSISKDLILSKVQKLSGDFALFAEDTADPKAREMYERMSRKARHVYTSLAHIWADKAAILNNDQD